MSKSSITRSLRSPMVIAAFLVLFLTSFTSRAQGTFHKLLKISGGSLGYIAFSGTVDGGAVAACHRPGGSAAILALIKVGRNGNLIWSKAMAPTTNASIPSSMVATPDSGVAITFVNPLTMDSIMLMKLDKAGTAQWSKTFRATYFNQESFPVYAMQDGSILFAHSDDDSLCLKKFTAGGQLTWAKNYRHTGTGIINPSGLLYHDAAIYIAGYDGPSYRPFLIKADGTGNIIWQKYSVGPTSAKLNMLPVQTGGIVISTVRIVATPMSSHVAFIRPDGTVKWAFEVPDYADPQMCPVGPATFGLTKIYNGILTTVIIDTLGVIKGARSYTDSIVSYDHRVAGNMGRGFWISGFTNNALWLMRTDASGNSACFTRTETIASQIQTMQPLDMSLATAVTGAALTSHTFSEQPLTVTDSTICSALSVPLNVSSSISCLPNPFVDEFVIQQPEDGVSRTYVVISPDGKLIAEGKLSYKTTVLQSSAWATGLYFLKVTAQNGETSTFRLLKR